MNRSIVVCFLAASVSVAGLSNASAPSALIPATGVTLASSAPSIDALQSIPGKSKKHKKKMSKQMKKKKRH